jgi:hypothetical protein
MNTMHARIPRNRAPILPHGRFDWHETPSLGRIANGVVLGMFLLAAIAGALT